MNRRSFVAALAAAFASRGMVLAQVTGNDPMAAAQRISELERQTYIPQVYEFYATMHPDARALIPLRAVYAWYSTNFWPRGPQTAVATGVNWLSSWTWGVTGQQYSDVAEVSYYQYFDDGSVDNDIVRITNVNGQWHWWFGRSPEFVQEWDDRTNQLLRLPQSGDAPHGLSAFSAINESFMSRLPREFVDPLTNTPYTLKSTTAEPTSNDHYRTVTSAFYQPEPSDGFNSAHLTLFQFHQRQTPSDQIRVIANMEQDYPFATLLGWNTAPTRGLPWVDVYSQGFDVVAEMWSTTIVTDFAGLRVSAYSESVLKAACAGMTQPGPIR